MSFQSSYDLIFRKQDLADVLATLAAWNGAAIEPIPYWGMASNEMFCCALDVDADDVVAQYAQGSQREVDAAGRVHIGCIWLTIHTDLEEYGSKNPEWIKLDFSAAVTRMNPLFDESCSFRRLFVSLLESHNGIYAVLSRVEEAFVIWFEGEECFVRIDDAFVSYDQIQKAVKEQAA